MAPENVMLHVDCVVLPVATPVREFPPVEQNTDTLILVQSVTVPDTVSAVRLPPETVPTTS